MKFWTILSRCLACIGMFAVGLVSQAKAQWRPEKYIMLHRGQIAHCIFNPGMTGMKESGGNNANSTFSYPQGRRLKVYSGGAARFGWANNQNGGGEGIWILSNTQGVKHVSAAGSIVITPDIESMPHNPSTYPEAYLGVVEDEDWALAYRTNAGAELPQVWGVRQAGTNTNWWPARGGIARAQTPIEHSPVMVWNFRYGRYSSGRAFADGIADGDFQRMGAPAWVETLSEDDYPEVVGISKARSKDTGLQWTRKWYQWGHPDYDDFLINENGVENTSGATVENVYIAFRNRFWAQSVNGGRSKPGTTDPQDWSRDDHARSTVAANYLDGVSREDFVSGLGKPGGLPLGKDLADQGHAMLYYHDGESDHYTNTHLDVGDPYRYELATQRFTQEQTWIPQGFIQHGQYFGIGVVDAFPPFNTYGGADRDIYVAAHDNPDTPLDESQKQPATVAMWQYFSKTDFENPDPSVDTPDFIYDTLTQAGYMDEPEKVSAYSHFMVFGPYDLSPGEKAKVIVAYAGGMGANDPRYDDYKRYPQPFNFGWMDLFGGTNQPNVAFENRQREIPLGEDALFRHFQRAIDVYNWGYDISNQPPNVKLSWDSDQEAHNRLYWSAFGEDAADPDYEGSEARDLRGYRIYRSTVQNQGPWEFVAEFSFEDARAGRLPAGVAFDPNGVFHTNRSAVFPEGIPLRENPYVGGDDQGAGDTIPGLYTFVDTRSLAGFGVHYSVRFYDSGHEDWNATGDAIPPLESAPCITGGAIVGSNVGLVPTVPGTATFDRLEEPVQIVPNPWKADDDLHTYNRQQNIRFINIPGRCQIDLYDVTGQRIWTFFNNDVTQGEITWLQFTENRPSNFGHTMAPGIYFWKVTSFMPGSEGKIQSGTFAIIK